VGTGVTRDEPSLAALLATVRDELDATAELPVAPAASPWLGEAAAVAEQATDPALDDAAVAERLAHLDRLLDGPDPDNDAAAARVATARTALDRARDRLDGAATPSDRRRE
jgi:hypothetical protein